MKFILTDLGSSFIKAAVYDLTLKEQLEELKYPTPPRIESADRTKFELPADILVQNVKNIISSFCSRYSGIEGIIFSTQQHGCVIRHPEIEFPTYISWQDTRSLKIRPGSDLSYMEELEKIFPKEDMESNGVYIKPALALCNLYTLFEETGLSRRETLIDTLGSYVIEQLTGNRVCHITNAAPMGFTDIKKGEWRYDMLKKVGFDFFSLPRIARGLECCGRYIDGDINIAVYPDTGDVQTCVCGTGAVDGDLVINMGTSGQVVYVTDKFIPGNYEVRPYYSGDFCNVISRMPGGRNLDVLVEFVRGIGKEIFGLEVSKGDVWNRINNLLGDNPSKSTEGLEVDCGFYELPESLADGKILHGDHSNLKLENVMRAAYIDFGRKYRHYKDVLCPDRTMLGKIYFAGGAAIKNPCLREVIRREIGAAEIFCASNDEVYKGLQILAHRCVSGGA